jgi:chromosome segregation ATPase
LEKLETDYSDLQNQFEMMKSKYENKCVDFEDASRSLEQIKDQLFEKEADYRRVLQESKSQENDKNNLANQLEDLDERLNSYNELKAELKNAYHNNQMLDNELINMKERVETVEKSNKELAGKEKENLDFWKKC